MKKKTSLILLITLIAAVFLSACGADTDVGQTEGAAGLSFSISELTEEPTFIDWKQEGTAMQLIALKSGDEVRLAFNTCQSCQGSPWAWFEYLGEGKLQCHNCGQVFGLETEGTAAASGCNPITVTDFKIDGDTVTVPESFLKEHRQIFENWKWGES